MICGKTYGSIKDDLNRYNYYKLSLID